MASISNSPSHHASAANKKSPWRHSCRHARNISEISSSVESVLQLCHFSSTMVIMTEKWTENHNLGACTMQCNSVLIFQWGATGVTSNVYWTWIFLLCSLVRVGGHMTCSNFCSGLGQERAAPRRAVCLKQRTWERVFFSLFGQEMCVLHNSTPGQVM